MNHKIVLTLMAAGLLTSCAYNAAYTPADRPERMEFGNNHKNVYPEDVRKDPGYYTKVRVAWAGVVVTNEAAEDETGDKITMNTVFEHHYFNWEVDDHAGCKRLLISPRGEGRFRMHWKMDRKVADASSADALQYAVPGSVAVIYGTPETVDEDGTIIMHYRYIRIFGPTHFTGKYMDYGRVGEPYRVMDATAPGTASLSPSNH